MKIKIRKNKHYPFPYFFIPIPKWISKNKITSMKRRYWFDESCLYDLHDEDQLDINKLFGFSIGWHHNTSFRFGWRANLIDKKIEIFAYEYQDKIRQKPIFIDSVELNNWVTFELSYLSSKNFVRYSVMDKKRITRYNPVNIKKKNGLGYTLGLYFGGNKKAPQDIHISIEKK